MAGVDIVGMLARRDHTDGFISEVSLHVATIEQLDRPARRMASGNSHIAMSGRPRGHRL
jgi:hypothetical protein